MRKWILDGVIIQCMHRIDSIICERGFLMKRTYIISMMFIVIVIAGYGLFTYRKTFREGQAEKPNTSLTILWAEWTPADYLQELTKDFTTETGIDVRVVQESWGNFQQAFFTEMGKKDAAIFDLVVGDSQWLGKGSSEGHYVELTKWIKEHGVDVSMTTASITGYSEYPKQSGHYWAVPAEGDAMGFSYRKDLFENPEEKAMFREKYGYELGVPETWYQLKDIAEFFYRPEKDLYGVLNWCESQYDGLTMGVEALIWAWGAALGDDTTYRVRGILNSEAGIEALKFYKALNQYNNPAWIHYYLDTNSSSNQPMMDGKVAMAMGYFAINPELLDAQKNPYADVIGFFACPKGPKAQAAALGGQGLSIVSYSKKKEASFQFLEWFVRDDTQQKWAQLGGLSCNKKVLYSDEFLQASAGNRPFMESMLAVRDFWAVPEYSELLRISQKYWYEYVVNNSLDAADAMNYIAREWETIFENNGYYTE